MPSRHHDNFAGGLLELESQIKVASSFGLSSAGSCLILTWSGGTANIKIFVVLLTYLLFNPYNLQNTFIVIVSNNGISVAEFAASHLYLASLSVTFVKIVISEVTDLSVVFTVEWIFLSFLYQVIVANGFPPDDVQEIF